MFSILNVMKENYDYRNTVPSRYCLVNMPKLSATSTVLRLIRKDI